MKTTSVQKSKHRRGSGQGLVEFALIIPVLLLIVAGTAEFGRLFAIYSNLFNAAREGTRYGMVNGDNLTGTLNATLAKVELVDPSKVTATVSYDTGLGADPQPVSPEEVVVGNRVKITLHYDVEPMLPFLEPLLSGMSVDTEAVRTIARVGTDDPFSEAPNKPPIAEILMPIACIELSCTFDGSPSHDLDGDIVARAWDFGDLSTGSGLTTTHDYVASGTYTVTLDVMDDDGATDSASQGLTVNQPPVAVFTYDCTELSCTFDASASTDDPGGTIVDYAWDFGDTTTGNGVTDSHSYGASGTYTVTLTVKDNLGATGSVSQDVTVNQPPVAAFTYSCTELSCTFNASTSTDGPGGTIVDYAWDFGDTGTGGGVMPIHNYAAGGTYLVKLTVRDDLGAMDSVSQNVKVNQSPVATFEYSCKYLSCTFDASASYDPDGTISTWTWDFGDGNTGNGVTASHDYGAGGTYPATLTVTDHAGATSSVIQDVTVFDPPNLIVESVKLENIALLTYTHLEFTVSVKNIGGPTNTWFWVDLYLYPQDTPPVLPPDPATSDAWVTVGGLASHERVSLLLEVPAGVSEPVSYVAFVVADSTNRVTEAIEDDNHGSTTFSVSPGIKPTPGGSNPGDGAISGSTWLSWNGDSAPQGRVQVSCYTDTDDDGLYDDLVADTYADLNGDFTIDGLAPGFYTVTGVTTIGGVPYISEAAAVTIAVDATGGVTATPADVTLLLGPAG